MKYLSYAKKAAVGGGAAAVAAIVASGEISKESLVAAAGAFVVGALGVFLVKNGPKPGGDQ